MTRTFGTDGIRGPADQITDALAEAVGRAAVRVLGGSRLLIGRDPRASGPRIVAALARGARHEGAEPVELGVAPTPAVAWVSADLDVPAAMVSASHNAWHDNGIKLFAAGGRKLDDDVQARLEAELGSILDEEDASAQPAMPPDQVADVRSHDDLVVGWAAAVGSSLEGRRLDGIRVVLDCANGAASELAPGVLEDLGATLTVICDQPDGTNINEGCGSTNMDGLAEAVVAQGAHVGLAFDGDADRVLAVDETGGVVDGDQLIAICALDRHRRGVLAGDAVVVTVMTNLGFRLAMARHGIGVVETPVGDRHVLEALAREGLALGGEQSGHVVFADLATTGDGLLAGIQLLDVMARTGHPLSRLAEEAMTRLPQVLRNVRVDGPASDVVERVAPALEHEEQALGAEGRVLVRPSGTEPVIRVMVEAPTSEQASASVERIVAALEAVT